MQLRLIPARPEDWDSRIEASIPETLFHKSPWLDYIESSYPHDDQTMYFWDSGYDPAYLHLSPNELLHWTAMKERIARGLSHLNIGGAPRPRLFTRKFGGNRSASREHLR